MKGYSMNTGRLISIFFTLFILCPQVASASPEGQLYWVVGQYPTVFFLHNTTDTYSGAEQAIDYACRQAPGTGTYSGTVRILTSSVNYPAEKAGYCRNTRPFFPGSFDGNLYYAYLYCNGVQRGSMDDSNCQAPVPAIDPLLNLGAPCPMP